jgi:transketolase
MLNPYLHLNEGIFKKPDLKPVRDGFGEALVELGKKNPKVVVLTADLKESTRCEEFAKEFPDRFFEVGVAEQNLAAIAAGLGVSQKIPFICSYAVFSPGKNWETIRTTIAYNNSNVKIAGHHAGIVTGADGATHQATEDLAIVRSLPNFTVFVPCDALEAKKITLESARIIGPVYLRFSREKTPLITSENTPFAPTKVQIFWTSSKPQVAIFATGHVLYYALLAAKNLEKEKIQTLVVNVSTIKPVDENMVTQIVKKCGAGVTVEDHQVIGGLGSTISEILAKNFPAPLEFIGLQNTFAQSGEAKELIKKYKMDETAIMEAAKKVIARKHH